MIRGSANQQQQQRYRGPRKQQPTCVATRARIAKVERYSGSGIYSVTASAPARVVPVLHLVVSRGRPDLFAGPPYILSLSVRHGVDSDRSSPLSLSPSVPVVVQISQAAFILRLSDILYSLSLLGPPPSRYSCAVRYETRPSTVSRCATRSERGTRRASCSVPYLLDSLHAVRFHGSRLYVSLFLSFARDIYIYRISSDAHRRMPPHLRDKRTKLVVTNIAKREGMSNEILFESSFSLKIPFVSRNGGKGTRVSLRYTLRQGARRESARGGEGG